MRMGDDDLCNSFPIYGRVTIYGVILTTLMYFAHSGIDHMGFLIIIAFSTTVLLLEQIWWKSDLINKLWPHLLVFIVLMGWVAYLVDKNYVSHIMYSYLTVDAPEMSGKLLAGRFEDMGLDIEKPSTYKINCKPQSVWVAIINKQEIEIYGKSQIIHFLPKNQYKVRIQNDHIDEVDYKIQIQEIK